MRSKDRGKNAHGRNEGAPVTLDYRNRVRQTARDVPA
jgi:hypothetical protein